LLKYGCFFLVVLIIFDKNYNQMKNIENLFFCFTIILLISSCNDSDNSQSSTSDNYNRSTLLNNLVENIIIPAHENFSSELNDLNNSISGFENERTIQNLELAQSQFIETYKAWQHIEMFNIGYSEEIYYVSKMNIYPANVTRILSNIESQDADMNNPYNYSSQGFPALDYLLFGLEDSNEMILNTYIDSENSMLYLSLILESMLSNTEGVIDYWNDNKNDFMNSDGNTSTSSLNMLANDFVYYFEKGLRANKIGIPAGVWSGLLPQNVEAFYKGDISKILAKEALQACSDFFNGIHFGSSQIDGEGLYDYLDYLDDTNYADSAMFTGLNDDILNSFENSMNKLNLLENNFAAQIQNDNVKMLEAYQAIQQGVVRLKTNMLSVLGISVDYYDADGD